MGDILAQKGYYDAMISQFEEIQDKRHILREEVTDLEKQSNALSQKVANLTRRLQALDESVAEKKRESHRCTGFIDDLEAGGTRAKRAMMRLARVTLTIEQRAQAMREDLHAGTFGGAEPISPKLGSSKKMHHEAVVTRDMQFMYPGGAPPVKVRCYSGAVPGADSPPTAGLPVLVFFHGEGYVAGDLDSHDWLCRSLAAMSRLSVAAVDYRRAPEDRFPAAFEDAYAALRWVASGGLGEIPPRLGVAGDCAGAGLAAACCLRARDDPDGPELHLQLLFYPWLDLRPDAASLEVETTDADFQDNLFWFRHLYTPLDAPSEAQAEGNAEEAKDVTMKPGSTGAAAEGKATGSSAASSSRSKDGESKPEKPPAPAPWFMDPRASPLLASSLAGLPRAFIAYAEDDPVAGDAVAYAERLVEEGGKPEAVHTLHLQGPCGHGFAKCQTSPEGRTAVSAAAAFASAALKG